MHYGQTVPSVILIDGYRIALGDQISEIDVWIERSDCDENLQGISDAKFHVIMDEVLESGM